MNKERLEAYRNLINALLNCNKGEEWELLQAHQELVDAHLIQEIQKVAEELTKKGDERGADFLQNLVDALVSSSAYQGIIEQLLNCASDEEAWQILEASWDWVDAGLQQRMLELAEDLRSQGDLDKSNFLMNIVEQLMGVHGNTSDAQLNFLMQVLQANHESRGNTQVVYPLLQDNLHLLDERFAQVLRNWATATLSEVEPEQAQYMAVVLSSFSNLIRDFPLGDRASNVEIVIAGYEAVIKSLTQQTFPEHWAETQINLGFAYLKRVRGEQEQNLEVAIHHLLAALEVFSYEAFPQQWATAQYNLGIAYLKRIAGEQAENLEVAIRYFLDAIEVYSRQIFPERWADIQHNLGCAYNQRIQGEQAENLEKAIQCYLATLEVFSRVDFPLQWAKVQNNFGNAYRIRICGEKVENLKTAIGCFSAALEVFRHDAFTEEWIVTQENLSDTRQELIQGIFSKRLGALAAKSHEDTIEECQIAFLEVLEAIPNSKDDEVVYSILKANLHLLDDRFAQVLRNWAIAILSETEPEYAQYVAEVLVRFGSLISQFPEGNRASNLEIALTSNELAATIFKREIFPEQWARIQSHLGCCYRNRVRGERGQNLEDAIVAFKAALQVFTQEAFPDIWAIAQHDLGNAYCDRIRGERAENLECALTAYKSALQVFTYEAFPEEWAQIQYNLAMTYYERILENRSQNLEQTIAAYEAALKVYTQESFPEMWENTRNNLKIAYNDQILIGQRQNLERLIELSVLEWRFLRQLWQSTSESGGDPQVVYSLLQANLEKLNDELAKQLRSYAAFELSQMEPSQVESGAKALTTFCNLISTFPLGSKASNLEIAIAGYEVTLTLFTLDAFPQAWAITQMNLGDVYRERIRGDRAENLESAIAAYESALQVLTYEASPQEWAQIQYRLGIAYKDRKLGDPSKNLETAIAAYESALQVLTYEASPQEWAVIQDNLGNAYQKRVEGDRAENLEKAIEAHQSALQVFTKEEFPQDWAMVQGNLGVDYRIRIRSDRAENLEKAIVAYQSALQVWTYESFPDEWATAQNNLGNAYGDRIAGERLENLKQAIAAQEAALTVWTREAFPEDWIKCQNNLCGHFLSLLVEAWAKSDGDQNYSQVVYPLLQAHLNKLDGDILTEWWQSFIEFMLFKVEPEKAKNIAIDIANLSGLFLDDSLGQKATNIEIALVGYEKIMAVLTREAFPETWAQTKHNLGFIYTYRIRGDRAENLELAICYLEEALKIRTIETFPEKWADIQNSLGMAYFYRTRGDRAENLELAIHCFEESLTIYTREAFLEQWRDVKNHLGVAYSERVRGEKLQNIENAIAAYQDALTELTCESSPDWWAQIHNNLGIAYGQRIQGYPAENLETAFYHFKETQKIYTREAAPERWASLQRNLGIVYKRQGQIDKGIESFRSALKIYTPTTSPVDCLNVGRDFGNTAFEAGRWAEAIEGYQVAIEAVEQSRFWSITEERRQEILAEAIGVYVRIVQTFINNGQRYQAIEYVERSKARNLVEILATRNLYPKGEFPEEVLNELDRLRRLIAADQRRIDGSSSLNVLRQQLDDLITEKIKPIDPTFSLTQRVESLKFYEIRKLLPDNKTSLIEWYVTPEYLYTFLITPEQSNPIVLQLPSENHQALLSWFGVYLQTYITEEVQWQKTLSCQLQELAELLQLDQLLSLIPKSCDQLILIPHRFLHLLPLHALPYTEETFLLDRFSRGVRYAPSCQLLQLTQNKHQLELKHLFGIQNPTQDLNYSNLEMEALRQYFFPHDYVLKNNAAKKANINNQLLSEANCIHFASHGYFNFENPLKSAILLADCKISPDPAEPKLSCYLTLEDGITLDLDQCLSLGEIFALDLNQCRLVVLSACETGLTDFRSLSDEYIGIPSSFLYAGASSVVSSLWTVNDLATAFLMIKFYDNLQQQTSIAVALNQAQIWLRDVSGQQLKQWIEDQKVPLSQTLRTRWLKPIPNDDQPFREPFYWAAFCAIGQ